MDINKCLAQAIDSRMDFKGITIEINNNFNEKFFDLDKEVDNDNVRIYTRGKYGDIGMILYVISEMLKENSITINLTDNATVNDIEYLKRLSKSL